MRRPGLSGITDLGDGKWRVSVSAVVNPSTGERGRISQTISGTKDDAIMLQKRLQMEHDKRIAELEDATDGATLEVLPHYGVLPLDVEGAGHGIER